MSEPGQEYFNASRLGELLNEVDRELGAGDFIEVVACGGAALVLKYDVRSTGDVDVVSEAFPDELRRAVQRVGERNGLPEAWMNDAAKIATPRLPVRPELVYGGERLKVYSPGPHFLLAMKLFAGRDQDMDDAVLLIREIGYSSADDLLDLLEDGYKHTQIPLAREYFARRAYQLAGRVEDIAEQPPNRDRRDSGPDIGL